jgi:phosphoribosylformylglycinamidine cyclo-ligase
VDVGKVRDLQRFMVSALGGTFHTRKTGAGAPLIEIGHYSGMVDLGGNMALTLHTDGVGTKVLVAQSMGRYDTVGIDCVAMTVNDLICLGSEPIALLDYLALEREDDRIVKEIMNGLIAGAEEASVPIVGGETAILGEMIRGIEGHGFDLASMGVGIVEKDMVVDGSAIRAGDAIVGLRSSGLHSNGYTLARKVLTKRHSLKEFIPRLDRTLGDELLTPTKIYVRPVLRLLSRVEVHGLAHITGGAFTKLARLTGRRDLSFRLEQVKPLPVFGMLAEEGRLSTEDMYSTFNMGVGFCVILSPSQAEEAIRVCRRNGFEASAIGTIGRGRGVYVGKERLA